jgi:hypothetical protein
LAFIAPLIASLAVGGVWYLVLRWSLCRNKTIATVISVILALLLYLGYYHIGLLQIIGVRKAHRIDLLPRYVHFGIKTDVARDARLPAAKRVRPQMPDPLSDKASIGSFSASSFLA